MIYVSSPLLRRMVETKASHSARLAKLHWQESYIEQNELAGQNVFSQKCAQVANSLGPATYRYFCAMYFAMSPKSKGIKGRRIIVAFRCEGPRHFHPLADEDDGVLLSDSCAKSYNDCLWWMPLAGFTCKALWVSLNWLFDPYSLSCFPNLWYYSTRSCFMFRSRS